jgi:methyl-branched lipid omega-hydroxylase
VTLMDVDWPSQWVRPPERVPLDAIDLGAMEGFWDQPDSFRDGAFFTLRHERPVSFSSEPELPGFPVGPGFWSVTTFDDVWKVSRQPKAFSSVPSIVIPDLQPEVAEFHGSMIVLDDPRHARLRMIVQKAFTPKMVRLVEDAVRSRARSIVERMVERHPDGRCEIVREIAAPLPLQIICSMMGIPEEDEDRVFGWTNVILGEFESDDDYAMFEQVSQDIGAYGVAMAMDRRSNPRNDLCTALVQAEVDGERLSDAEIASFFILLATAGNETTRNAISHGLVALTAHPDQRAVWLDDIDGVMPTAVDEIVRWATPVMHFRRTAACDTMIGDQAIAAGDKVVIWYISANRDEAKFDRPDELDLRRTPNDHLGFGGGPHFCLGAHVARREIAALYSELLRRLPDIEAAGPPDMLLSSLINGIKRLPCRFTPAAETVEAAARASSASTLTDGGRS